MHPTLPRRNRGLSQLELLLVLAILGILGMLAVSELKTLSRRTKTEEAVRGLADMFNGVAAHFNEQRPGYGVPGLPPLPAHRCPHPVDQPLDGEQPPTPPLDLRCADGPRGRCTPRQGADGPGTYDLGEWTQNPVWQGMNFRHTGGHRFHYSYSFRNSATPDGHGACEFTVRATADLDGDGVWSVYERSGFADRTGVNADAGLRMQNPLE